MRAGLAAWILVGCASSIDPPPPSLTKPGRFGEPEDTGPERFCGVVPGTACTNEGKQLARCLCGPFEQQVGRLICCREGRAFVESCQSATTAVDCDGRRIISSDAAAD